MFLTPGKTKTILALPAVLIGRAMGCAELKSGVQPRGLSRWGVVLLAVGFIFYGFGASPAEAKRRHHHRHYHLSFPPPTASSIVLEADGKRVLYENAADEHVRPASLTKMMTLYLTFEQLAAGKMRPDDPLTVSRHAAGRPPERLGLRRGSTITVAQAVLAVITKSANDAATVLGESIGGSEENFARMMNETARKIGMKDTNFANASGLPDSRQYTTARDMSTLSLALIYDYPQFYSLFATRRFAYGRVVTTNHNHLLGAVEGVDGIKTGFISTAGFNLAASAQRNGKRLVVIVMGGTTPGKRDRRVAELIAAGFSMINHEIENLDEDEALSIPDLTRDAKNDAPSKSEQGLEAENDANMGGGKKEIAANAPSASSTIEDLTAPPAPVVIAAPVNNSANDPSNPAIFDETSVFAAAGVVSHVATPSDADSKKSVFTASSIEEAARANLTIPDRSLKQKRKKHATLTRKVNASSSALWAVQVGAFGSGPAARKVAEDVRKLSDAGSVKVLPKKGSKPWRVRIIGLPRQQALDVCSSLSQNGHQCMVIPARTG